MITVSNYVTYGLLVLACIMLMSCGPSGTQTQSQTRHIYEINLDDGTRCAVFDAGYAGGLSCDWK